MEKKLLIEDNCLRDNLSYTEEKDKLIKAGYILIKETNHPAIGKTGFFEKPM